MCTPYFFFKKNTKTGLRMKRLIETLQGKQDGNTKRYLNRKTIFVKLRSSSLINRSVIHTPRPTDEPMNMNIHGILFTLFSLCRTIALINLGSWNNVAYLLHIWFTQISTIVIILAWSFAFRKAYNIIH